MKATIQKFVQDHKIAITVVATATITVAIAGAVNKMAFKEFQMFLKDNNLETAYYGE